MKCVTKRPFFTNPSRWQPPPCEDSTFTAILDNIVTQNDVLLDKNTSHKSNVSNNQWYTINQLKDNDDIVIKTADKGGATVIIDKSDYHCAMEKILADRTTYITVPDFNLNDLVKKKLKISSNPIYRACQRRKLIT